MVIKESLKLTCYPWKQLQAFPGISIDFDYTVYAAIHNQKHYTAFKIF